jgi:transcriptional regulator with XRE-family HTH domain
MPFRGAIRRIYRARGLHQSDLAAALRVDTSTVSRWLSGDTAMSSVVFEQLMKLLGVVDSSEREWLWLLNGISTSRADVRAYIRKLETAVANDGLCDDRLEQAARFLEQLRTRRPHPPGLPSRLAFADHDDDESRGGKGTDRHTRRPPAGDRGA